MTRADEVRQFLHRRRISHKAGSYRSTKMPAVRIGRDDWNALRMDWQLTDGQPPLAPRDGAYWWRDVPLIIKNGGSR